MMQKRSSISLMLISFIVVLAASSLMANTVIVESKLAGKAESGALNVTADVTADSVTAIEVVLEISAPGDGYFTALSVSFDPGFIALNDRQIDVTTHYDGTTPDTIRFAALRLNADAALGFGQTVIAQINYTTNTSCGDVITLAGGTFDAGFAGLINTQFVDAATTTIIPAAVTAGTVTIVNQIPTLATIIDATLPFGDLYVGAAVGADADAGDVLSYALVSGPSAMSVNATTGAITWATTGADVGSHAIDISVVDQCGGAATTSFTVCVTNAPPVFNAVANQSLMAGGTMNVTAGAVDADGGPNPLLYSATTDHPGALSIDPTTGAVTLVTSVAPNHTGSFTVTVIVTDGANISDPTCSASNADTVTFAVDVFWNGVTIEDVQGQTLGAMANVSIDINGSPWAVTSIAGYDLRVEYDAATLAFQSASAGQFHTDCNWEYFTYRFDGPGNLHIIALSDQNDGVVNATCFDATGGASTQLTDITFLASNNPALSGLSSPIRFRWIDCGDNSLSNVDGQTHMISRYVSDLAGSGFTRIDGLGTGSFPTLFGAQASCDAFSNARIVDFFNGGVTMASVLTNGNRGDINVNGLANEVGDAVMFTNFFLQGLSAFLTHVPQSVAASDANADGIVLSVSDLVYLIRVVVGDAPAIPKVGNVAVNYSTEGGIISVDKATLGGAHLVVAGNVEPKLLAEGMDLGFTYDVDLNQTNILVTIPMNIGSDVKGFTGDFLEVHGEVIGSPEFATLEAASVTPKLVPKSFKLGQNYPNPFNPSTTIRLSLPQAGPWSLTVYNISGQVVKTFEGETSEAGFEDVVWDASNVASGVYFYRTRVGDNTATKKAILLK